MVIHANYRRCLSNCLGAKAEQLHERGLWRLMVPALLDSESAQQIPAAASSSAGGSFNISSSSGGGSSIGGGGDSLKALQNVLSKEVFPSCKAWSGEGSEEGSSRNDRSLKQSSRFDDLLFTAEEREMTKEEAPRSVKAVEKAVAGSGSEQQQQEQAASSSSRNPPGEEKVKESDRDAYFKECRATDVGAYDKENLKKT